ncbi:hypothetical protein Tco_0930134, partial [Tanacetum coccineum]
CDVNLLDGTCLNCTYGDGKLVTCGCEGPLKGGFYSFCASRNENSFTYDSNLNYFNNDQNFSDYAPQPQNETYLCELCGKNQLGDGGAVEEESAVEEEGGVVEEEGGDKKKEKNIYLYKNDDVS